MNSKVPLLLLVLTALPLRANDEKVNAAIQSGASYLLGHALSPESLASHGIGPACLAGLALLEADVKPDHTVIQAIHKLVRSRVIAEVSTYEVSLAAIFLDRLGDPGDVALLQILGTRLMMGQTLAGGWGYSTCDPIEQAEAAKLASAAAARASKDKLNPTAAAYLGRRAGVALGGDDNSNTQFALLGLWVCRRNGVPADHAFLRLQSRFLRTQSPLDSGWAYSGSGGGSGPSMTCAGLLGLAAGKALSEGELRSVEIEGQPRIGEPEDDPFTRPPPPGTKPSDDDGDDARLPPPVKVDPTTAAARDKAIERALSGLGKLLLKPAVVGTSPMGGYGGVDDLYFYWSLERVGVALGVETIGGVDWYKWGLAAILPAQQPNGSWAGHYSTPVISTSFAMLFLKKANFASDLTRMIKGKVLDPGGGELRGGRGVTPAEISAAGTVQARKDDPQAPGLSKVRRATEADRIAEGLVTASSRDWPAKLRAARDTTGPQYTVGLSQAIAALEGRRLYQAREALAERLTRMTGDTLKRMLSERDAEIRRAACLAVAMKDDRFNIPGVIDRITDPNDSVSRAARAALKAMSGEDHGPTTGAGDEEKRKAADAWRFWYETDRRKSK